MTRSYNRILTTVNPSDTAAQPPESINIESNFVVIVSSLLCALICIVGLMAVARCTCLRRNNVTNNQRSSNNPPAANKSLNKKFVDALPKYTYDGKLGGDCAICLADYLAGDEIRVLPQCGHQFHIRCIDLWLGSHSSSCPSCRKNLVVTRCKKCGELPAGIEGEVKVEVGEGEEGRWLENSSGSSSEYLP